MISDTLQVYAFVFIMLGGALVVVQQVRNGIRRKMKVNKVAQTETLTEKVEDAVEQVAFVVTGDHKKTIGSKVKGIPLFGFILYGPFGMEKLWVLPAALTAPFVIAYGLTFVSPFIATGFVVQYIFFLFVSFFLVNTAMETWLNHHNERTDRDIPVFLDSVERGLRVGKSFEDVIMDIGEELDTPLRKVIERVKSAIKVGISPADIFFDEGAKKERDSFFYIGALLAANAESGGSMSNAVETLSENIRLNRQLDMKIVSMSQETRFAGYALSAMPFIFVFLASNSSPKMTYRLWETTTGNYVFYGVTFAIYLALLIMTYLSKIGKR